MMEETPTTVAGLAAAAFGGENSTPNSCLDDPNFATICSFIQNFGEIIRIGRIPFDDLQKMLENTADVPHPLVQLHITLLRRVFKSVTHDKWERSVAKFVHTYCSKDAWEIERFGYKKAKIDIKLRLLKNLLEAQFDYNVKFKAEVNKLQAADLRLTPLGRDTEGQVYWYQVDEDANLRVYREDIDDETWEIVASSRDELEELISQLQRGEVKRPEPEETIILPEEDSNSKDDIEPKEIILDTGKVEDSTRENSSDSDDEEEEENQENKKTVEPLIIKHSFNLTKTAHNDVDDIKVKSEVDNEVHVKSEPKPPGIKMVFGMKSRTNNDSPVEVSSVEIKSCNVEENKYSHSLTIDLPTRSVTPNPPTPPSEEESPPPLPLPLPVVPKVEPAEILVEKNNVECTEVVAKEESVPISQTIPVPVPVPVKPPSPKISSNQNSELSAKFDKPLTKTSKNLQKSAKVNSIVARLNRNLPDQTVKTVADLIPPPEDSTRTNVTPKVDPEPSAASVTSGGNLSTFKDITLPTGKVKNVVDTASNNVTLEENVVQKAQEEPVQKTKTPEKKIGFTLQKMKENEKAPSDISQDKFDQPKDLQPCANTNQESVVEPSQELISSIIPDHKVSVQDSLPEQTTAEEKSNQEKLSKVSVDTHKSDHQPSSIFKDKVLNVHVPEPQAVPMDVEDFSGSTKTSAPVKEDTVIKTETWKCGEAEVPVEEKLIDKVETCVRGDSSKSRAKPEVPVEEKPIDKLDTWVCGDSSKSPAKPEVPVEENPIDKLDTWVCGNSKSRGKPEEGMEVTEEDAAAKPSPQTRPKAMEPILNSSLPTASITDKRSYTTDPSIEADTKASSSSDDAKKKAEDLTVDSLSEPFKDKDNLPKESQITSINAEKDKDNVAAAIPIAETPITEKEPKEESEPPVSADSESSALVAITQEQNTPSEPRVASIIEVGKVEETAVPIDDPPANLDSNVGKDDLTSVENEIMEAGKSSSDVNVPGGIKEDTKDVPLHTPFTEVPKTEQNVSADQLSKEDSVKDLNTVSVPVVTPEIKPCKDSSPVTHLAKTDKKADSTEAIPVEKVAVADAQITHSTDTKIENKPTTDSSAVNKQNDDKVQESKKALPPVVVKSGLGLVLYSESSDSSNDGFCIDTSVGQSQPPEKDRTTGNPTTQPLEQPAESTLKSDHVKIASEGEPELPCNTVKASNNQQSSKDCSSENGNGNPSEGDEIKDLPLMESEPTTIDTANAESENIQAEGGGVKRKAEEVEEPSVSKLAKLEAAVSTVPATNPIVGETVEEEVMTITGEGSGAANEGGNSFGSNLFNPICGETIEEEIMFISGEGQGFMNQGSNENSPLSHPENSGSQNDSIESEEEEEESRDAFPKSRGRGGRRGRGRRGRPSGGGGAGSARSSQSSTPRSNNRGSRVSREVAQLGVPLDSTELNGDNERPVRASRRIAQIRLKEEEERRKLEEERLAQLKAAQMQKKAKQEEKEKRKSEGKPTTGVAKVKKGGGRKSQKGEMTFATEYLPSASESEEDDEEEDGSDDEFAGKGGKGGKRRRRRKNGKAKKGGNPWATSDEDEEEQVEEEEEYHYEEEEEEELVFKSDHEFSPESDLGEDADVGPSRHARTAKQDKGDLFVEGNCCKCRKGDHPEWILLCDKCDNGWHASCLRPQLWYIPEGDWFCPPCQHNMLIENLNKNLVEYEGLLKKRENEILRKQRLAYVGISLDNVLPDKEPEQAPETPEVNQEKTEKKKQRRRILSDEELSEEFINDSDDDALSRSRSGSDSDSDEPVYRLRARRTKKAFDFKEYDDMINSALRVDDDEEGGEIENMDQDEEDEEEDEKKLNGDDKDEEHGGAGGGKNDAFLKHLERQALDDDETDEELLDEKERLRRKELKKQGQRKAKRRINDLDAYSEEEDSDDDFKASEAEDEDEELAEEGESEWSGDKMEDDSDDSIAKRARRKDRQGRHGRLGRREKYSEKGLVRRSTRKRRKRISYDESDDEEEEEEDQNDKWQSEESEEEEEESESNSESDDATWGRKKKKAFAAAKPKLADFVLGASSSKGKGKGGVKRKKRKTDEDDTDRAWNSARGKREKDEPVERRTRGRKINFKDILDSGESDDDGNVRPKRRPLSDSDDSRSPSSSRKLAEEIRAENARKAKEYEEAKKAEMTKSKPEEAVTFKDILKNSQPPAMPESLTVAKLAESSVNPVPIPSTAKAPPPVPVVLQSSHAASPSPNSIPNSSPLPMVPSPASVTAPLNSSPVHPLSVPTPPLSLPSSVVGIPNTTKPGTPPILTKSPLHMPYNIPKTQTLPSNSIVGCIPSSIPSKGPIPIGLPPHGSIPTSIPSGLIPPNLPGGLLSASLPGGSLPMNIPSPLATALALGSSPKPVVSSVPPPVPVSIVEKKSSKQSKGSRGSRGSKSEKPVPPPAPAPPPSDLELALSKPVKTSSHGGSSSKSSSKKKDRDRDRDRGESPSSVPNTPLILSGPGGVLPELLGVGLPSSLRVTQGTPPGSSLPSSGSTSSKKSKSSSSSSRATQQTTPPPVSQTLSPSMPIDIDRVPNPALFQGTPGMRPFHPMWAMRNPGPPPGYSPSGIPVSTAHGKPPPLNSSPFSGQQGPPPRSGFPSPPPLRIPNPNSSPLQTFQHFKRDGSLGGPLYRLPPGQPQPGVPLPNILPPGMMSPHAGGPERFFGAPSGYPHPYGLLPPHSQVPPQGIFPYDYRPPEPPFKDEPAPPPRTTSSSLPTPLSGPSSSPPPTTSAPVPLASKEEGGSAKDSEFGGLVSYFSSQRSEEDMDS